jgi:ribonucleotide reductase alpha subunit
VGDLDPQDVMDGLVLGDGAVRSYKKDTLRYSVLYVGDKDQDYFDSEVSKLLVEEPFDRYCHRVTSTLTREELPPTYERRIPDRFFYGDELKVRGFLRGLFSANGGMSGPRVILKATSFTVIEQVQQMLSALGIVSYYTVSKPKKIKWSNGEYVSKQAYDLNITFGRKHFMKLIGFIQDYKMKRLRKTCATLKKSCKPQKMNYEVVEVEKLGRHVVWDITVDAKEHSYWTGNMLVSNCSEIQWLNNVACNLASLRITAYLTNNTLEHFNLSLFQDDIRLLTTAQDILIDHSFYPTADIAERSYAIRNIGLNYGDLGKFLFDLGLPYDSDHARAVSSLITAIFTTTALNHSKIMAGVLGPFSEWSDSDVQKGMIDIILQHERCIFADRRSVKLQAHNMSLDIPIWLRSDLLGIIPGGLRLLNYVRDSFGQLLDDLLNNNQALRNSALTVFVPMGTVGLALGCSTTGIEPVLSHRAEKKMIGGGTLEFSINPDKINLDTYKRLINDKCQRDCRVCGSVSLCSLYESALGTTIIAEDGKSSVCNVLSPESHIDMMAAVQPFISLGISKTVNSPSTTTVEEIVSLYERSWRYGLKAVTIYIDGSKVLQPVTVSGASGGNINKILDPCERYMRGWPVTIGGEKIYIMFGWHPEYLDDVWEVWLRMSGIGGTTDGFVSTIAIMASQNLQEGMRNGTYDTIRQQLLKTHLKMSYPPNGLVIWNGNNVPDCFSDIRSARSIPNLMGQMLASMRKYPGGGNRVVCMPFDEIEGELYAGSLSTKVMRESNMIVMNDKFCASCGRPMVKSGMSSTCYKCIACGDSIGGCG